MRIRLFAPRYTGKLQFCRVEQILRHWHGAAPDKLFSHLAMSELNDKGEGTAWFEHVSDEDYNAPPAPVT